MFQYEYARPATTADMVVFYCPLDSFGYSSDAEVLLINRENEPFKHYKALPGGYMEEHETFKEAAIRELAEETGVHIEECFSTGVYDNPRRDSRGRVISVCFYTVFTHKPLVQAGSDANSVNWYSLQDIKDVAFDHKSMIKDSWEKFVSRFGNSS